MFRLVFCCSLVLVAACSLTDFDSYEGRGTAVEDGGADATMDSDARPGGPNHGDVDGQAGDAGSDGAAGDVPLTVTVNGPGMVSAEGFSCEKDTCESTVAANALIVLIATPDADAAFAVWDGPCEEDKNDGEENQISASLTCTLTARQALAVTANFAGDHWFDLRVSRSGTGKGTVASVDGRIVCDDSLSQSCSARYVKGATVELAAAPSVVGTDLFSGWGGACAGSDACLVTMNDARIVEAVFNLDGFGALIVTKPGKGRGLVESLPVGVSCGEQCSASYSLASASLPMVMLTATPDDSSSFGGFSGDCVVQADPGKCLATVDGIERVSADFAFKSYGLSVTWAGNGEGKVSVKADDGSTPVSCTKPETCAKQAEYNTTITLTAEPTPGSMFAGWLGGGCGTEPSCTIDVTQDTMLVADFAVREPTLTVSIEGDGVVTCNGMPCSPRYAYGSEVSFAASPAVGWELAGWGGACAGTAADAPCVKSLLDDTVVIATFAKKKYQVSVTLAGTGTGSVSGTVTCDPSQKQPCTLEVSRGDPIKLTAAAATGSTFAGWGGACGGTADCVVDAVDSDTQISATFTQKVAGKTTLVVAKTGKGTITSAPVGISCAEGCSGANGTFTEGSTVELTATPATGYGAATFSGCDTNAGAKCQIAMNDPDVTEEVAVSFPPSSVPVTVTIAGTGTGNVAAPGITCATGNAGDCSENRPFDSTYVLTATPSTGSTFAGWDAAGACAGVLTPTCEIKIDPSNAVTATFTLRTFRMTTTTSGGFDGTSRIARNPAGSACTPASASCSMYGFGADVTLTATAGAGSSFVRWSGDAATCGTNVSCAIADIAADKTVSAEFATQAYQVAVAVNGSGAVRSKETPTPRIDCTSGAGTCAATYMHNSSVTLEAGPPASLPSGVAGVRFSGWSGACSGTSASCVLNNITSNKTATAAFINQYGVSVTLAGDGVVEDARVYVTGTSNFTCSGNADPCVQRFDAGTSITLSAATLQGTRFTGWQGVTCSQGQSSASCTFALNAAASATATFVNDRRFSVDLQSTDASGAAPMDITDNASLVTGTNFSCTGANDPCVSSALPSGTRVTLTAASIAGLRFLNWSGVTCTEGSQAAATCTFTLQDSVNLTATYVRRHTLTLSAQGRGAASGTLLTASAPGAPTIGCTRTGSGCTATIDEGSAVHIVATPPRWAYVTNFSAGFGCTMDPAICDFTIRGPSNLVATFTPKGNLMFVTEATYAPTWGSTAPTAICTSAAQAAGLDVAGPFIPWVSTEGISRLGNSAITRYSAEVQNTAPIIRVDGEVITQGLVGMLEFGAFAGSHIPINLTEFGNPLSDGIGAWTGTNNSGDTASTCSNWSQTGKAILGTIGDPAATNLTWTNLSAGACLGAGHIYCIQDSGSTQ